MEMPSLPKNNQWFIGNEITPLVEVVAVMSSACQVSTHLYRRFLQSKLVKK